MSNLSEWDKGALELNRFLMKFILQGRAHVPPEQMQRWLDDVAKLEPLVKEASSVLEKEIAADSAGDGSPLYRLHDQMIDLAEPWIRDFPGSWRDDFRDVLDGIDMYPGYDEDSDE